MAADGAVFAVAFMPKLPQDEAARSREPRQEAPSRKGGDGQVEEEQRGKNLVQKGKLGALAIRVVQKRSNGNQHRMHRNDVPAFQVQHHGRHNECHVRPNDPVPRHSGLSGCIRG